MRTLPIAAFVLGLAGLGLSPFGLVCRAQPAPEALAGAEVSGRLAAAIELVFERMERAVMSGDQEAYMALLDHTDPVFVQEHENWAKDLARGLPAAFDMVVVSDPVLTEFEADGGGVWREVRAMVEMRYTPGTAEGAAAQEPRVIRYRARFTPAGGVGRAAADPDTDGALQLLYGGEAWEILERGSTRVMFAPKWRELASVVADALPPIRIHVDAQTGSDNSEHIQVVKLYGDMQHLQASIYLSYVAGLSGWNEPGESIKIMAREGRGPRSMDGLLSHEYGHAATFWMGESANAMPWWTLEGIADYVSQAYRADYATPEADPARERPIPESLAATIRSWAAQDRLPPWEDLTDFYTVDPRWTGNVYTQGNHMVAYITDRFGVSARNSWLRTMARGASLNDATRSALGLDFATLDREWRAASAPEPKPEDDEPDA